MDDPLLLFSVLMCYMTASQEGAKKSQEHLGLFHVAVSCCGLECCPSLPGGQYSVFLGKTHLEGSWREALRNPLMSAVCSRCIVRSGVLSWLHQP